MDRRKFIAVGVTALLAGCDSQNTDETEEPTEGGTPGGADGTPDGGESTPEDGGTITPGGGFDADVTFDSCTRVTVDAESYSHVFLVLAGGGSEEYSEGYTGENTFPPDGEAGSVINSISVVAEDVDEPYNAPNPDAAECREQAEE